MMERRASAWCAIGAVASALALAGCGGHVAGLGDDDSGPGTDSGVDSGPGYDAGPGTDSGYWDSYPDVPGCTTESPCVDSGTTCPVEQPPLGSPCYGSAYCSYAGPCGSVNVACVGGSWTWEGGTDAGCGTCPPSPPPGGLPCSSEGLGCGYSTCPDGSVNVKAVCTGGRWSVDSGPCSAPGCPTYEPPLGTPCDPSTAGKCEYANGCGGHDYLYCSGVWSSAGSDCSTPTCPTYEPPIGSYCGPTPLKCDYPNACGGDDTVICPGTGGGWTLGSSFCPPPPTCPTYEPPTGSPCFAPGGLKCTYPNGCGGSDYLSCAPWGAWSFDGSSCSGPTCPPYEPITGTSCAGYPGGTTCDYPPGSTCPQPCVCGADGRWTCYTVLCDAGPPPPPPSGCDDFLPCLPGTGCATPCYKSCSCGPDGLYHCTPMPCDGGVFDVGFAE